MRRWSNRSVPAVEPIEEYKSRLRLLAGVRAGLERRDRGFIGAKLLVGLIILAAAVWLAKYHSDGIAYLLVPVGILLVLFAFHERTLKALRQNASVRRMYEAGVGRLEDRWTGQGDTGERYLQAATGSLIHPDPGAHPYARDLDLFGSGSMYELLCTARTSVGQDLLAKWLLEPADIEEIHRRQEAVRELALLLDFRERMTVAASAIEQKRRRVAAAASFSNPLISWSQSKDLVDRKLRWPALVLALLWSASVVAWLRFGFGLVALGMSVLNATLVYRYRSSVGRSVEAIEGACHDLDLLADLLAVVEKESFTSEKLTTLQQQLHMGGAGASAALSSLSKRCDWLFSNDNWFVKIVSPFVFWKQQCVFLIEDWRARYGPALGSWVSVIGEIEALNALAVYFYENPDDVFAVFTDEAPLFEAEDFSHPLLPRKQAVANSLRLDRELRLVVISGPNMAGKSTFIRSIGVNAVLAQAGAPVRAKSMRLSRLTVAASICILDSLQGGLSRFYAEIMRLKHIDALSRLSPPLLFLLDELLSGTNSHDRRSGTESMVRSLVARGAIGLVTTHDLALAEIAAGMGSHAANFHFEDSYENGELHFEYKLSPGIVQTSNALQLMRSIGLDV